MGALRRWAIATLPGLAFLILAAPVSAATVTLYQTDFENPFEDPPGQLCTPHLSLRSVNYLHGPNVGGPTWSQIASVETTLIEPAGGYLDPAGTAGRYSIGMIGQGVGSDRVGFVFDALAFPFVNIGLDLSAVGIPGGCGIGAVVGTPVLRIKICDNPGPGAIDFGCTPLDQEDITGPPNTDPYTFVWSSHVIALDKDTAATPDPTPGDGNITVVFDLLSPLYASFDNLILTASDDSGDVGGGTDCGQDAGDLASFIRGLDVGSFAGSSARRQRVLASRAEGAANALAMCRPDIARARMQSLADLTDGVATDYMVDCTVGGSDCDVVHLAALAFLVAIDAGECNDLDGCP